MDKQTQLLVLDRDIRWFSQLIQIAPDEWERARLRKRLIERETKRKDVTAEARPAP